MFLLGCGGTAGDVEFQFPHQESFIITHYMKLEAYIFEEGDEDACEKLLKGLPIPNQIEFKDSLINPCVLQNGMDLSEFDSKKLIYHIQGLNKWDVSIVSGCEIATLSESKKSLKIQMDTTHL